MLHSLLSYAHASIDMSKDTLLGILNTSTAGIVLFFLKDKNLFLAPFKKKINHISFIHKDTFLLYQLFVAT